MLYVGGLGRSGSTLIERLIGQVPGACAVGELVHLWERGVTDDERCGCGEPFRQCPFWQQVGKAAFGGWDEVDVSRVAALRAQVDRNRFIPALARGHLRPGTQRGDPADVDLVPPAERRLTHQKPERALAERIATTASLVVSDAPVPQVDKLTHRADPGKLPGQPLDHRAAAAPQAADVQHPDPSRWHRCLP